MTKITRIETGATLPPLSHVLARNGKAYDLTGKTVKFQLWAADAIKTAETADNVTIQPESTFTTYYPAEPTWLIANDHNVCHGDQIVVSNSGGELPANLTAGLRYFARDVTPNTFSLSRLPDGEPLQIGNAGSGTHSFKVIGQVLYQWQTADTNTEGRYQAWWTVYTGTDYETVPNDNDGIAIEVFGAD